MARDPIDVAVRPLDEAYVERASGRLAPDPYAAVRALAVLDAARRIEHPDGADALPSIPGPLGADRQALLEMVTRSLRNAESVARRLRRTNTLLLSAAISSSAMCTLFAGMTATAGKPLIGQGTPGWRLVCAVSAVLAFLATLCLGLSQQLRIGDRLATANQAVGRLRSLYVAMVTSSRSWDGIAQAYADIEQAFPEYCESPSWLRPAVSPWPPPSCRSAAPAPPTPPSAPARTVPTR
jgi:hypothetical protein